MYAAGVLNINKNKLYRGAFFGILFSGFIAFNSKNIFNEYINPGSDTTIRHESPLACKILESGGQEFDLLWPGLLEMNGYNMNIHRVPQAVIGSIFLNHEKRLEDEFFYSATDKLMLEYAHDAYKYKKFGISPEFTQFYFYCFSIFAPFILFFMANIMSKIELYGLRNAANFRIVHYVTASYLILLFCSAFDFTIKYYILYFVVLFGLFFISKIRVRT